MRKVFVFLAVLCCVTALDSCVGKKPAKHVIMIGIDGWGSEAVRLASPADIPNVTFLMENGSWTLGKRSVMPSASAINWASIFNGLPTEMHGFDKWNSTRGTIPSTADNGHGIPPTIYTILREQMPSAESGIVYDWDGVGAVADTLAMDFNYYIKTYRDEEILVPVDEYTKIGVDYIKEKKPTFFTFYYGLQDEVGHLYGWYSEEYQKCQSEIDNGIGMIIQAVKDAGILDDTIIIVTSDHGGVNKGHGGFTMPELETPFIVYGKNVRKGFEFPEPMMQYDVPATIASGLGLEIPGGWRGKPMTQIFK